MRQTHVAGERLFVDFAGQTVPITDPITGAVRQAQIFVAALGASNYTYAEARWSQGLADWIGCHVNALNFVGGVPRQIVCDNLKAGVTSASRYEPGINRTYQEMAAHYGTAIVPTRVRKPRDKAKVEVAVQVVERWVLAKLRRHRFFSLGELNAAISELIDELNSRTMRRIGSSRRALFEAIERPALQPLPAELFEYAEWKRCRTGLDYHVEVHGHWYSVQSARWWRPASPTVRWRSSTTVCALLCMFAARCGIGTPRCQTTCRARIVATPIGRRPGCDMRPGRSVPPPLIWWS
jgi:transposase